MLTAAERQQLLVTWNDTVVDYPADDSLHQLVEKQVERTPDAIAIRFEDAQITYEDSISVRITWLVASMWLVSALMCWSVSVWNAQWN